MIRRPPRSTLFPSRRSSDLELRRRLVSKAPADDVERAEEIPGRSLAHNCDAAGRSEEHTSELQSHVNLVCRLLLEKKKENKARFQLPNCILFYHILLEDCRI